MDILLLGCLVKFPGDAIGIKKANVADWYKCFLLNSVIGHACKVELPFHLLKLIGRRHPKGDMIQADTVGIKAII